MILENGTVRTMEPSLPRRVRSRSRATASREGSGRTRRRSRARSAIDLGGRCVLPGFTDSHVHFLQWSLAQNEIQLKDASTLEEAVARVCRGGGTAPRRAWIRGSGWRSGDWSPASSRRSTTSTR